MCLLLSLICVFYKLRTGTRAATLYLCSVFCLFPFFPLVHCSYFSHFVFVAVKLISAILVYFGSQQVFYG